MDWTSIVIGVCAVAAVVYLGLPMAILATYRMAAELALRPTRIDDLNEAARRKVSWLIDALGRQGFVLVSNCRAPDGVPGVLGVQMMFVQPESRDIAFAIFASSGMGVRNSAVTFRTYFGDGTQIVTASSTTPGVYPRNPMVDGIAPHWIDDPAVLHAIHRARVVASGRAGEPRVIPEPGAEIEFQAEDWRRELQFIERAGYQRRDPDGQSFNLTWKGAYLMTWRIMWPGKWIRGARQRARARQVLRQLRAAGHDVPV